MGKASEKTLDVTMEKEITLEENFAKLEETITRLEAEDISLEAAFTAYSKGMELLKACNEQIDQVEKKVLMLGEDGGLQEASLGQ